MSASQPEIQVVADELLKILGVRIHNGSLTIHFAEGRAETVQVNTVPWRREREPSLQRRT